MIPLGDTPCPVELVLPPEWIPGYTPPPGNALLRGALKARDQALELFAEDLALDPGADDLPDQLSASLAPHRLGDYANGVLRFDETERHQGSLALEDN